MSADPPRLYIFHGADEFSQKVTLAELKEKMGGDPAMVDLNTSRFSGRSVQFGELVHACNSLPFLSDRRLVIVEGLIEHLNAKERKAEREALLEFLPQLPPSTRLVLLEKTALPPGNPFIRLASDPDLSFARQFDIPTGYALVQWVIQQANGKGGDITRPAAALLAANAGDDLHLLDMELEKLLGYVGLARPVQPEDVELLTPYAGQVVIFDLVDAIGQQREQVAATLLRRKLDEGEEPLYLLAMITRQFRLLIQVKEKLEQDLRVDEIGGQIKLHPFVTRKIAQQAGNFTLPQLDDIYRQLLDTDVAIKTGRMDPAVAVDLLVVELARAGAG